MALKPITVSQLNDYISRILTNDPLLSNIPVKGEISNLKFHGSGHVYFSLIDKDSKISCFLPASYVRNLKYEIGDGLEVTVYGNLNVYKKGGSYTLFVRNIEVSGEGNLAMAFEMLKSKLEEEGLFDPKHKKAIPKFPKRIGVVTSETGAAVRDIIKIIQSRTKLVDVIVFPVLVQGQGAAENIADTIDMINLKFASSIDTLIVGRGGGSMEDLWAFNEEVLARAVYKSKIPIISAVGHEIDFSICDFVADLRAETPTAAAEKVVPSDEYFLELINAKKANLTRELDNKLSYGTLLSQRYMSDIKNHIERLVNDLKYKIEHQFTILEENNPSKILSKGYAILENPDGKVISSQNDIQSMSKYKLHLKDGIVEITISEVSREGGQN